MIYFFVTYYLICLLIVTIQIHVLGKHFFLGIDDEVKKHNDEQLKKYRKKQISAGKYKQSILFIDKEKKFKIKAFYFFAPIIGPVLFIGFLTDIISYIQALIKLRNM